MDTIFARSSGSAPAAIGIIRISGPQAGSALEAIAGRLPAPRTASLRRLRKGQDVLDDALVLWFPGPESATGEDCAELHCHGGRAVLAAVEGMLGELDGLRPAEAGEFTRRAFANGRMDLTEAEGLADLLAAETEFQRRAAIEAAGGHLGREIERWREIALGLSAQLEAAMDFADEDDVGEMSGTWLHALATLREEIALALARPPVERLRDGVRVVLAGPPNAGKSSLFNAILQESVAIVTPHAGTTRDAIERSVSIGGMPFILIDTAGLRYEGADEIEQMGIAKSEAHLAAADLVLWLGPFNEAPKEAICVASKADIGGVVADGGLPVSAVTGEGLEGLLEEVCRRAEPLLPVLGLPSLNERQRAHLFQAAQALQSATDHRDPLLIAEDLRLVRISFDRLTGRATTEDMLDALFGRFCIGK